MAGRLLLASACSLFTFAHLARLAAQDPPNANVPLSFEVASVRANTSGDAGGTIRRQPGGRFNAVNVPLRGLILLAYELQSFQLVSAPGWIAAERFDIVARMTGDPPPRLPGSGPDHMMLALRTLLANRFQLVVHTEAREMDIYALVTVNPGGKPGPALKASTIDCSPQALAARRAAQPAAPQGPDSPVVCSVRATSGRIQSSGSPLSQLAFSLSGPVGRFVVDRTGLAGRWDFELIYTPERPAGQLPPGVEPIVDANAPSLFTALQEQLGLKLDATRGPVEVLVVDNVQRPTRD